MRKLKIAFLIDSYSSGAGTENQLRGLLRNLDSNLVEARLFTLRGTIDCAHKEEIPWPIESFSLDRLISWRGLRLFFQLTRRLRRERYDLLMLYFVDSNFLALPASFFVRTCKAIVNRRNMGYYYDKKLSRRLRFIDRLADHCLVNSEAVKHKVIQEEGIPANQITVIANANWEINDRASSVSRSHVGLQENTRVIGIVANLRPVKRIDRFIEMAGRIIERKKDVQFLILGQGELENDLRSQVRQLGLDSHVIFAGSVNNVRAYLALMDVGVLTSESEGLSNSLIEYAMAGLPAVAFDVGGNSEVVDHDKTGFLVPSGDIAQMADSILSLLSDSDKYRYMSRQAKQHAIQMFAADRVLGQYMRFFYEMTRLPIPEHFQ